MTGSESVGGAARDVLLDKVIGWYAAHGVGDTSLRLLARELGTSHRMLLYHFDSREGLLAAVVEAVERRERAQLVHLMGEHDDPFDAGLEFWTHVADAATTFAPLFFELSGHAMQGRAYAASLRSWLTDGWTDLLTAAYTEVGLSPEQADRAATTSLALARGLLFGVALGGDRAQADAAIVEHAAQLRGLAEASTPR